MFTRSILALGLIVSSSIAAADRMAEYEVTITNITPGQSFTPQLVVTHTNALRLFDLGTPASVELEMLAEGGDTAPLTDSVDGAATEAITIDGLLGPGQTVSTTISGYSKNGVLSIAAMMIPTNDAFVGLNSVPLPEKRGGTASYLVPAYDAGTEVNDQSCQHMPGPRCNIPEAGFSEESGEGFVHIGNGFHDLGDIDDDGFEVLGPKVYDWRNSVARITVRKMSK
jgi:hypothetical protein